MSEHNNINTEEKKEQTANSSSAIDFASTAEPAEKVTQIEAKVDLTKKPESRTEYINILNDDEFDKTVNLKTEGDIKKEEAKKATGNVDAFREQINKTASPDNTFNPSLAQQQAESWVTIVDMGMRFILKMWSGQADNTGLEVGQKDKETLAAQLAIALSEYKVVIPILITVLTTFAAMYATPIMNAKESKKKIDDFRAEQKAKDAAAAAKNVKMKPEFNPETGKHVKKKGGQYKA